MLEDHFKDCGSISRTTIRLGPNGKPMGYAYMEFLNMESAIRSKTKNETLLQGRQITVMQKRKNLPKLKERKQGIVGPNPLMMQACAAMMMAACNGNSRGMMNQF